MYRRLEQLESAVLRVTRAEVSGPEGAHQTPTPCSTTNLKVMPRPETLLMPQRSEVPLSRIESAFFISQPLFIDGVPGSVPRWNSFFHVRTRSVYGHLVINARMVVHV